jgi:hypothetical protein
MRAIHHVEQISWQSHHSEPPRQTSLILFGRPGKNIVAVWIDEALDRFPPHPLDHLGICGLQQPPFLGNSWAGALE